MPPLKPHLTYVAAQKGSNMTRVKWKWSGKGPELELAHGKLLVVRVLGGFQLCNFLLLQHMQQRSLSGVIQAQEQDLSALVPESKPPENSIEPIDQEHSGKLRQTILNGEQSSRVRVLEQGGDARSRHRPGTTEYRKGGMEELEVLGSATSVSSLARLGCYLWCYRAELLSVQMASVQGQYAVRLRLRLYCRAPAALYCPCTTASPPRWSLLASYPFPVSSYFMS
eukprot:132766-Rhodomonas_salina.1